MNSATKRVSVAAAIAFSLLLSGCSQTSTAPTSGGATGGTPATDTPAGASGADCSAYKNATDPELTLFSSSAIAKGPTEGQVYGDGSTFSVTLSQEALAAGLLPLGDVLNISPAGDPLFVSSVTFDPTTGGDGTFSTQLPAIGKDELVGKAVVVTIYAVSDTKIDGATQYGDKLLLGNYCMTYANDGS